MATRIIVDGYNLMWAGQGVAPGKAADLRQGREDLLLKLSRYKKLTGHHITVVFDGGASGEMLPGTGNFAGVEVRFSRPPQKADDLIRNMTKGSGRGSIIVTSDRELAGAAEASECTTLPSPEFMEKIELAALSGLTGNIEEEDYPAKPMGTKKRGNPRRPSKRERKRKARLKNL